MGQYWKFVNIDKRQDTGHLGKMGEFFFSGESTTLMYLLALPAVPLKNATSDLARGAQPAGSWAGDRIICLGDYADSWPKGKVLATDFQPLEAPEENNVEQGGKTSKDADDLKSPSDFTDQCRTLSRVSYGEGKAIAYPLDRVWVLRNLTKKIYVRSNGVPTASGNGSLSYDQPEGFAGYPGLGNILVANIGWSDDPSVSMCYDGNLVNGKWAGDRIDVRLFEDIEEEISAEGWADDTRKQAKRLYDIWLEDGDGRGEFPEEPDTHGFE
ncbi:hypothetical protein GALMADRAFT_214894 [Galerina marginata CBS 339.88]|uniref:Uncharacterized protein n=1 Tax=Galerina marginata (strain CBS 339.88) TaxID=685588 RepID=A0A067SFU6_GALM3|nr:hypothetical protein GALMADRAFT_214894 [Galerina marginata CBS 339.88]